MRREHRVSSILDSNLVHVEAPSHWKVQVAMLLEVSKAPVNDGAHGAAGVSAV